MLHQKINEDAKEAMIKKEEPRLTTLKGLKASFMNEIVLKGIKEEFLSDDLALQILKRAVKQRKDSISGFQKGKRDDLVAQEEAELKIIEAYLPKMLSEEEIRKIAEKKKTELGIVDKNKAGILVGAIMKEVGGLSDGNSVKMVVDKLFV